jgi:hypothetical protein
MQDPIAGGKDHLACGTNNELVEIDARAPGDQLRQQWGDRFQAVGRSSVDSYEARISGEAARRCHQLPIPEGRGERIESIVGFSRPGNVYPPKR